MGRHEDLPCQKDSIFYAHLKLLCSKHFHGKESTEHRKLDEVSRNCPKKGRVSRWCYRLMPGRVPWAVLSHGLMGVVALLLLDHVEDSLLGPHGCVIGLATRYRFEVVDKAA